MLHVVCCMLYVVLCCVACTLYSVIRPIHPTRRRYLGVRQLYVNLITEFSKFCRELFNFLQPIFAGSRSSLKLVVIIKLKYNSAIVYEFCQHLLCAKRYANLVCMILIIFEQFPVSGFLCVYIPVLGFWHHFKLFPTPHCTRLHADALPPRLSSLSSLLSSHSSFIWRCE